LLYLIFFIFSLTEMSGDWFMIFLCLLTHLQSENTEPKFSCKIKKNILTIELKKVLHQRILDIITAYLFH
jgi:hypothetical protein